MYVFTNVSVYMCTFVCVYIHFLLCVCGCICVIERDRVGVCTYVREYMCVCECNRMCALINVCVYMIEKRYVWRV